MNYMQGMLNQMRLQAMLERGAVAQVRIGTITGYNPTLYQVKVQIQPDNVETGWLPVASPWVGAGWGLAMGPMIGAQVEVDFFEGHYGAGFVRLGIFNDEDGYLSPPSGEFWLVHSSGNYLKFQNDGTVQGHGPLTWDGDTTITGNLTVQKNITGQQNITAVENISDLNGAHGTVGALRTAYDGHTHSGVQSGSSSTSGPSSTV